MNCISTALLVVMKKSDFFISLISLVLVYLKNISIGQECIIQGGENTDLERGSLKSVTLVVVMD